MSDNEEKLVDDVQENVENVVEDGIEDFIDAEEYEKALKTLESSKSIRIKEKKDKKKEEENAEKALKKEELRKIKEEKIANSKIKNKFIARCVVDPLIPACVLIAIVAVIAVVASMLYNAYGTPALNFTVDDLKNSYISTEIYTNSLNGYNFQIPELNYMDGANIKPQTSIALTADPNMNGTTPEYSYSKNAYYFTANIPNTATSFGTAIQGGCRKSDGRVISLRAMVEYSADDSYYDFLCIYFASYLQTVYPELTSSEAITLVQDSLTDFTSGNYTVRGDIAYRVVLEQNSLIYFALDIIPASAVDDYAPAQTVTQPT